MKDRKAILQIRNGFPYLLIEGQAYRLEEIEQAMARRRAAQKGITDAAAQAAASRDRWDRGVRLVAEYDGGPMIERPAFNDGDRG